MAVQTLELQISDNAAQAASNINKLANAMHRLQNAVQLGGIKELADRLRQISGIAGGGVVGEMATMFGKATDQMETFSTALEKATTALAGLRSRGRGSALSQVADDAKAAAGAMEGITIKDGPLGETVNIEGAAEAISKVETSAESATEAVEDLAQAMRNSGAWQPGISPEQVKIETIQPNGNAGFVPDWRTQNALAGHYIETLDRVASYGQTAAEALGQAVNIGPQVDQSEQALNELANTMSHLSSQTSMANTELERQSETLAAMQGTVGVADVMKAAFKSLGEAVGGLASRMSNLMSSFMRIAKFRLFRTILRAITTAFKEGVENVREYSKAINGLYAKDMANFDNAVLKMKNSLGASLAVAFQALLPVIQTLISGLITLANLFNQLMAMFSGHATWTKAVDVMASDFEDTKKNATGAAKAVKNLLADWDELNIIQSQGAGGGGGSGLNGEDYKKMFVESDFAPWVLWIRDHLSEIKALAIGIGAALIAWKIAKLLPLTLGTMLKTVIGIGLAVAGVTMFWDGFSDQLKNGVNWENLKKSVEGVALVVAGLGLAFGMAGLAVGLLVGGIALAIAPLKELIDTGKLSDESMTQLSIAIGAVGAAIALMTGSWVPILIAGIAIAVGWIIQKWDDIVGWWNENVQPKLDEWGGWWSQLWEEHFAPKVNWVAENITVPIGNFFTAMWGTITGDSENNLGTWWQSTWEGLKKKFLDFVVWFANNVTIPIQNFFIDCVNGILSIVNWFIQQLNTINFSIDVPEWLGNMLGIGPGRLTVGVQGISEIELLPRMEQIVLQVEENIVPQNPGRVRNVTGYGGIGSDSGTYQPYRSRNVVGTGGITGYTDDGSMGPVYYPAKSNLATYNLGVTSGDDPQMNEQTSVIRQIEAIVQDIRNKPFSVNITPSANLGRVVAESQNAWNRASGGVNNRLGATPN